MSKEEEDAALEAKVEERMRVALEREASREEKGLPAFPTSREMDRMAELNLARLAGEKLMFLGTGLACWPLYRLSLIRQVLPELQRQNRAIPFLSGQWPGYLPLAKHIVRTEGVRGLWRGVGLETAGRLFFGNQSMQHCPSLAIPILLPGSTINIRFATDLRPSASEGYRYAGWKAVAEQLKTGVSWRRFIGRLHRGFFIMAGGSLLWFYLYRPTSLFFQPDLYLHAPSFALQAFENLAPTTAKAIPSFALAAAVAYPFTTLRSRMVISEAESTPATSARAMLRASLQSDGFPSLYRGFGMYAAATTLVFLSYKFSTKVFLRPTVEISSEYIR